MFVHFDELDYSRMVELTKNLHFCKQLFLDIFRDLFFCDSLRCISEASVLVDYFKYLAIASFS